MANREYQELQYQSALESGVLWFRKAIDALSTTPHGLDEFADDDERQQAQHEAAGSALRQALKSIDNAASYAARLGDDLSDLDGVLVTEMFRSALIGHQPMDADRH